MKTTTFLIAFVFIGLVGCSENPLPSPAGSPGSRSPRPEPGSEKKVDPAPEFSCEDHVKKSGIVARYVAAGIELDPSFIFRFHEDECLKAMRMLDAVTPEILGHHEGIKRVALYFHFGFTRDSGVLDLSASATEEQAFAYLKVNDQRKEFEKKLGGATIEVIPYEDAEILSGILAQLKDHEAELLGLGKPLKDIRVYHAPVEQLMGFDPGFMRLEYSTFWKQERFEALLFQARTWLALNAFLKNDPVLIDRLGSLSMGSEEVTQGLSLFQRHAQELRSVREVFLNLKLVDILSGDPIRVNLKFGDFYVSRNTSDEQLTAFLASLQGLPAPHWDWHDWQMEGELGGALYASTVRKLMPLIPKMQKKRRAIRHLELSDDPRPSAYDPSQRWLLINAHEGADRGEAIVDTIPGA